jgi:hypothetical protein
VTIRAGSGHRLAHVTRFDGRVHVAGDLVIGSEFADRP